MGDEDFDIRDVLEGDPRDIDTKKEFLLASYFCEGLINMRHVEVAQILPKNRNSDLAAGVMVYKDMQELRFADPQNTERIGRYETMLKLIEDKSGVKREDIVKHFALGVAEIVDEEFNAYGFGFTDILGTVTYAPGTAQYELYYSYGSSTFKHTATAFASSLTDLHAKLNKHFTLAGSGAKKVVEMAQQIPAVVYASQYKERKAPVDTVDLLKKTIVNFYADPNQDTYNARLGIAARYKALGDARYEVLLLTA
ncbi:MAG: hypothetical protein LBT14_13470 [Treponema sp.]|jgi:hypothetical protein|nr:hypothetical protein [Treponema sp.]